MELLCEIIDDLIPRFKHQIVGIDLFESITKYTWVLYVKESMGTFNFFCGGGGVGRPLCIFCYIGGRGGQKLAILALRNIMCTAPI